MVTHKSNILSDQLQKLRALSSAFQRSHHTLMMETENVSEILDTSSELTWLSLNSILSAFVNSVPYSTSKEQ
jgi:hypothetical protein